MTRDHHSHDSVSKTTTFEVSRRDFLAGLATTVAVACNPAWAQTAPQGEMYGRLGKMMAVSGKRDELIAILLAGTVNMPGCLSYVIAKDAKDADALWITEVWDSKASHDASLSLPAVKDAITKGRPLIARFADSAETIPVGGQGLTQR